MYYYSVQAPSPSVHLRATCPRLVRAPEIEASETVPEDMPVCRTCEQWRQFLDLMTTWRNLWRATAVALLLPLVAVGSAWAQDPAFTMAWPHQPSVETYSVYAEPDGGAGRVIVGVVRAADCTDNQCRIAVPYPSVRTCYPILSVGTFQSDFNEIELCWRPRVPMATPGSATGSK